MLILILLDECIYIQTFAKQSQCWCIILFCFVSPSHLKGKRIPHYSYMQINSQISDWQISSSEHTGAQQHCFQMTYIHCHKVNCLPVYGTGGRLNTCHVNVDILGMLANNALLSLEHNIQKVGGGIMFGRKRSQFRFLQPSRSRKQ